MLVNRLLALLSGYLVIRFRGERVERFINLCLQQDILIWDIYTTRNGVVVGKISIDGFRQIRSVARRSRVTVHIISKRGLPFLIHSLGQRAAFTCGGLLFVITLYLLGSMIWFVDVRGTVQLDPAKVVQAAEELGIRPGVLRSSLQSAELSRRLVLLLPELSWAGVELRGSRAMIEVVEKKVVTVEPKLVGNVVATKSGVIEKIVPTVGKAAVAPGDTVTKGQVLISGAFQVDANSEKRYVHADGLITARVWYEGSGTSRMGRMVRRRTGRSVEREVLIIGERELVLTGPAAVPFALYEEDCQSLPLIWRNLGTAVEHQIETYYELVEEYEQVSYQTAEEEAAAVARSQAEAQLPTGIAARDIVLQTELLSDQNTVRVRAVLETNEAIGEFTELEPADEGGN